MQMCVRAGLALAVIVMMGCAERHVREDDAAGHDMECDPSVYGSPCCAICHIDDAGAEDAFTPRYDLPVDAGY